MHVCPFGAVGCKFQHSAVEGVQKHLRDDSLQHLALLCDDLRDTVDEAKLLKRKIEGQESTLIDVDNRLNRLAHRSGSHILWKIDEFQEKFNAAKVGAKSTIYSPPFLTSQYGYKLVLLANLNGDGKGKDKFMSVFISICRGINDAVLPWPFSHRVVITLVSQAEDPSQRNDIQFVIKPSTYKENKPFLSRPQHERNASFGAQQFVDLRALTALNFIKENCIFLRINVEMDAMNL